MYCIHVLPVWFGVKLGIMYCIALMAGAELLDDQDKLLLQKDEDILFASDTSTVSARDADNIDIDNVDDNSVDINNGMLKLIVPVHFCTVCIHIGSRCK